MKGIWCGYHGFHFLVGIDVLYKYKFEIDSNALPSAGLEEAICSLILDIEGKDPTSTNHGPAGKVVREMDWDDVCVWFEEIGVHELDIDTQREKQFSGRDYDHMIQKPWKLAIEEVTFVLIFCPDFL